MPNCEATLHSGYTGDPIFIFGAVAVGMFGMPALGRTMALAHYLGALLVGIVFRFYSPGDTSVRPEKSRTGNILGRAIDALVRARQEDARPFGQLLGDAVTDSFKTLWMICGFIMLFATVVKMIDVVGVYPLAALPFDGLFRLAGIDLSLVRAAVAGFFEIDLGTLAAARAPAGLIQKAAVAGAIIAWSGLSVHGQVASVLAGTDIRMLPYMIARLLHAASAYFFTLTLMGMGGAGAWVPEWVVPVLGGLPAGFARPGFWELFLRGLTWSGAIPIGLSVIGGVAAAATGGLRWIGFTQRRP